MNKQAATALADRIMAEMNGVSVRVDRDGGSDQDDNYFVDLVAPPSTQVFTLASPEDWEDRKPLVEQIRREPENA